MKKIIALALVALMMISSFSLVVEAGNYTSEKATTVAPVCDGKISKGEYDGAMVVDIVSDNSMVYYLHNAARTLFLTHTRSDVEAKGSKMLGNSKIYTLPTFDGLYFAFDIADTTIGSNYVRDVQWSNGMMIGDAVHVTIRKDNGLCSAKTFDNRDALRFSVAPFKNDWGGMDKGYRTLNMISAMTNIIEGGTGMEGYGVDIVETTGLFNEACTSDELGYIVEFFISWQDLKDFGFTGPTSYKNGESIYFNFMITDAMSRVSSEFIDWEVYQYCVNTTFNVTDNNVVVNGEHGYMIDGAGNWISYAAGSGEKLTFVVDESKKETETKKETKKDTTTAVDTKKTTESVVNKDTKKTHTETKVIEHVETKDNGETVIVTETETVIVEDETEIATETETKKQTEKETEKETKKSDKKVSDNNFDPTALIIIIVAVVVIAGAVTFIIIKKKKSK